MSENDASIIIFGDSRLMLQIEVSLTDVSRGIIYNCNRFIVQATGDKFDKNQKIVQLSFPCKHTQASLHMYEHALHALGFNVDFQ